uniref:Callose synthase 3 n=1 Tax=Tanacetum cinerariifolium TaxID=118510 RepID=A0A6L2MTZ8_TANCI|nr:callose synthase 3 [Tanacetum cinerariifolium]
MIEHEEAKQDEQPLNILYNLFGHCINKPASTNLHQQTCINKLASATIEHIIIGWMKSSAMKQEAQSLNMKKSVHQNSGLKFAFREFVCCNCCIRYLASEVYDILAGRISPLTGEYIKRAYGGEKEAFLKKVVSPICQTIAHMA